MLPLTQLGKYINRHQLLGYNRPPTHTVDSKPILLLQQRAEKQPEDLAIAFENQRFSWRQFNASESIAAFFRLTRLARVTWSR